MSPLIQIYPLLCDQMNWCGNLKTPFCTMNATCHDSIGFSNRALFHFIPIPFTGHQWENQGTSLHLNDWNGKLIFGLPCFRWRSVAGKIGTTVIDCPTPAVYAVVDLPRGEQPWKCPRGNCKIQSTKGCQRYISKVLTARLPSWHEFSRSILGRGNSTSNFEILDIVLQENTTHLLETQRSTNSTSWRQNTPPFFLTQIKVASDGINVRLTKNTHVWLEIETDVFLGQNSSQIHPSTHHSQLYLPRSINALIFQHFDCNIFQFFNLEKHQGKYASNLWWLQPIDLPLSLARANLSSRP